MLYVTLSYFPTHPIFFIFVSHIIYPHLVQVVVGTGKAAAGVHNATMTAAAKAPAAKVPSAKNPAANAPIAKKPAVKAPAAKKLATKVPAAKKPAMKVPAAKKPAMKVSTAKKPAMKVPVAKKPAVKVPAAKKPTVKVPAAKKPTVKVPAAKKPARKVPTKKVGGKVPVAAGRRAGHHKPGVGHHKYKPASTTVITRDARLPAGTYSVTLTVEAPPSGNIAPAGFYWLHVVDQGGMQVDGKWVGGYWVPNEEGVAVKLNR